MAHALHLKKFRIEGWRLSTLKKLMILRGSFAKMRDHAAYALGGGLQDPLVELFVWPESGWARSNAKWLVYIKRLTWRYCGPFLGPFLQDNRFDLSLVCLYFVQHCVVYIHVELSHPSLHAPHTADGTSCATSFSPSSAFTLSTQVCVPSHDNPQVSFQMLTIPPPKKTLMLYLYFIPQSM